jgi:hypothetical protein
MIFGKFRFEIFKGFKISCLEEFGAFFRNGVPNTWYCVKVRPLCQHGCHFLRKVFDHLRSLPVGPNLELVFFLQLQEVGHVLKYFGNFNIFHFTI